MKKLTPEEIVEIDVSLKEREIEDFLVEDFHDRVDPELAEEIGIDTAKTIYMQGVWAGIQIGLRRGAK